MWRGPAVFGCSGQFEAVVDTGIEPEYKIEIVHTHVLFLSGICDGLHSSNCITFTKIAEKDFILLFT